MKRLVDKNKGLWVTVGNIIIGFSTGVGLITGLIYSKDKHKEWKDKINDTWKEDDIARIKEDEVKQIRQSSKKELELVKDEEIKQKLGELKRINEFRNEMKKELEELKRKNQID
jgi:gas vesicle protein